MSRILLLIIFLSPSSFLIGENNPNQKQYNFFSFSKRDKQVSHELDSLTASAFKAHPDYGMLPPDAPCSDCMELQDHRTATSRYFIENGGSKTRFYRQQSFGAINYLDHAGWWRAIDHRLIQKQSTLFEAPDQPCPVSVNLENRFASIANLDKEFRFNRNLELYHLDAAGHMESFGTPDWSHFTAGDDGILIIDFYPGIDLQMIVLEGKLKTNFILNRRLPFLDGWLVMKQSLELPEECRISLKETTNDSNGRLAGDLVIEDQHQELFRVHPSMAYDSDQQPHVLSCGSELLHDRELRTYIPTAWLSDPQTVFPVVIDPLVSASNTLPQASITGSQYNVSCWTGGCAYSLSVPTPANCTVTDVRFSFDYLALGLCTMPDGGVSINYGSCRSPDTIFGAYRCLLPAAGTCSLNNISIFGDFSPCIPSPQCTPYNMNFTMNFYRCNNDPLAGCNANCIAAASAWSMVVAGETVRIQPGSMTPNQQICEGSSTTLYASGQYGVGPFSYLWSPSGFTTDTIHVTPSATTVYHLTVTDSCGINYRDSTTVNVIPDNNPGFVISPNPACVGQNVTITGLGAGAASNYDWLIPGSTVPSVNNTQSFVVQYPIQGNYNVTLNYQNGGCVFSSLQQDTIHNYVTPSVGLTANPAGSVCAGTIIVFTATAVNGGTAPSYQWKVNGVNAGTNSDTFSVALNGPSTVSVTLTSSYACLNTPTATAQLLIPVTATTTPSVNITSNPAPPFCSGATVVFAANPVSGGITPVYQWQLNGVNTGTNSDTFSIATLAGGDIVGVSMASSINCPSPSVVSDTIHAIVNTSSAPSVNVSVLPNDTVCAGTNVQFNAVPVNGGGSPAYQWYLNGVALPGATFSGYVTNAFSNGSIISVVMTSSLNCVTPANASDSVTMTTIPNVAPVVNLSVSTPDTICAGTHVVFTALPVNGGTAPVYQWSVNGVNAGTNSDTFSVTLNATSTILVVMTSNYNCLLYTGIGRTRHITVLNSGSPAVSISSNPAMPYCPGANVVFTATPALGGPNPGFQWQVNGVNAGLNSDTFSVAGLANGDIIGVTMTSGLGCVSPSTATDTVHASVLANVTPSVSMIANPGYIFCSGTPVTFTANSVNGGTNPTFQWYVNSTSAGTGISYSTSSLNNNDTIRVIATSSLACASPPTAATSSVVTVHPLVTPSVSLSSNPAGNVCAGTMIHFSSLAVNGGTLPSYQWLLNGNQIAGANNDTFSISTLSNGDAITIHMISNLNCVSPSMASDTILVNITPSTQPAVSVTVSPNDTACSGDNLLFTAVSQNGGTAPVYQWQINRVNTGINSPTYSSSSINNGDTVTVMLTSNAFCVNPATAISPAVRLTMQPLVTPSVTITSTPADTICNGGSVVFQAFPVNGGSNPAYQWSVNNIPAGSNASSYISSALQQGDLVNVQLTSNATCLTTPDANSNSIRIIVYPPLQVTASGSAPVCPDVPVTLQAVATGGNGGPYQYTWNNNAGNGSAVTVSASSTTAYTVYASDACSTPANVSVTVTVFQAPEAIYSYDPSNPTTYQPQIRFTDLSLSAVSWLWNFGDGDTTKMQNPVHSFPAAGTYPVSLVVMNSFGCSDTITYSIVVKEDLALFIPNSFTPNGDGRNEFFSPMGQGLDRYEMFIYDRWGNEIFHGGPKDAWTGTIHNGKENAPDGIYMYRIELNDNTTGTRIVTGRITLIR